MTPPSEVHALGMSEVDYWGFKERRDMRQVFYGQVEIIRLTIAEGIYAFGTAKRQITLRNFGGRGE